MKKLTILLIMYLLNSCSTNTKIMTAKNINFYTQYGQFYLSSDNGSFLNDDSNKRESSDTFNESLKERLSIEKNALVVFSQSYGHIKGEIEVLEEPKGDIDYAKYDHIVEGGINVQSGELQILSWPGNEVELSMEIKPARYRVRIYGANLDSVTGDDGDDFYRIELWKSDDMERKVLKQYERGQ